MKIFKIKIISFILLFPLCNGYSQWTQNIRLTYDTNESVTSYNNARCIAASGNTIHVVWMDNRVSYNDIFYKRSTDCGNTWESDFRITNNPWSTYPCIAVSGLNVYTSWNYGGEIYLRISSDGGINWGDNIRVTNFTQPSSYSSIAVSGTFIHVTWIDFRNQHEEIFYKHSSDNGLTWGPDISLSYNFLNYTWYSSVASSDSIVHVVWGYNNSGGRIFYNRSSDRGFNWSNAIMLKSTQSSFPSVSSSGPYVHAVWEDWRDGNVEIYYKRSTNAGLSWETDVRLTNDTSWSEYPNVTASGSAVHVVWYDRRNGNYEVYYRCSKDNGASWEPEVRLTNDVHSSRCPSVAACGPAVHVVWTDDRDGNNEIYYTQNPTGNTVSLKNTNTALPQYFSLSHNYPNPFNPKSNIKFQIAKLSSVKLIVFDVLGREISTLVNEKLTPGTYQVEWDGSNYPSGMYFYKLITENYTETRKMVLVK